ncbi:hypothetical protein Y032_0042g585 [Ancylostoma ceylanicum]|uniref:Uncharacterized protein n=1 Tax=Ancylostoma ceylanicum TaxID=53326 RepID=A0A016UG45_9BILA|nr:hypothetical protein Y032_0042g585 [Ancylostoma ceylanicum]
MPKLCLSLSYCARFYNIKKAANSYFSYFPCSTFNKKGIFRLPTILMEYRLCDNQEEEVQSPTYRAKTEPNLFAGDSLRPTLYD